MRRIVIDTNCLLAILPSQSAYHRVWTEFLENKLEICVSTEVLMEYEEILSQKTSPFFADAIIKTLLNKRNLIRISPVWRFGLITADPDGLTKCLTPCEVISNGGGLTEMSVL